MKFSCVLLQLANDDLTECFSNCVTVGSLCILVLQGYALFSGSLSSLVTLRVHFLVGLWILSLFSQAFLAVVKCKTKGVNCKG